MMIDVSNRKLPKTSHPSSVEITYDMNDAGKQREVSYEKTLTYINGLVHPVTVTDRTGMMVMIQSGLDSKVCSTTNLEVVVTYRFRKNVIIDPLHLLDDSYVASHKGLLLVRNEIAKQLSRDKRSRSELLVSIRYSISPEQFRRNGNDIYVSELDCTFSLPGLDYFPTHPESNEGEILRRSVQQDLFSFGISINDPSHKFGERFINIFNEVFRVPVRRDPSRPEGILISGSVPLANEVFGVKLRDKHLSFEDAEALGVFYYTVGEAEAKGNLEAQHKREEAEWKKRIDEAKRELDEAKLQREEEIAKRKHDRELWQIGWKEELETLQRQRERRDMLYKESDAELNLRRQREKDAMEAEMLTRQHIIAQDRYRNEKSKNESSALLDVLKWIPLAVTAVIGVVAFFTKLMPSK